MSKFYWTTGNVRLTAGTCTANYPGWRSGFEMFAVGMGVALVTFLLGELRHIYSFDPFPYYINHHPERSEGSRVSLVEILRREERSSG